MNNPDPKGLRFDSAYLGNNPYDVNVRTIEKINTLICRPLTFVDEKRLVLLNHDRQFVKEFLSSVCVDALYYFTGTN